MLFLGLALEAWVLHFSLGLDLQLSYWVAKEWRIHIPTNGANSRFSGAVED